MKLLWLVLVLLMMAIGGGLLQARFHRATAAGGFCEHISMKLLGLVLVLALMGLGGALLQRLSHAPFLHCVVAAGFIIVSGLVLFSAEDE